MTSRTRSSALTRRTGRVLAALLLTILMGSTVAQEPIVLDFPSWQVTEPGTSDWWMALIEEFEQQNPDIRIEFQHEPYSGYNQKMLTRMAGGNPPDIFHSPASALPIYVTEGFLAPLDSYLEGTDIKETWNPFQATTCELEGQTYCLLVLAQGHVLGYNAAMFEAAGIEGPPTNAEELLAAAEALTIQDASGVTVQYGFAFPTVPHSGVFHVATGFLFEYDPEVEWVNPDGSIPRDAITFALETMSQLVDIGAVPLGIDNNAKRQFFMEGRAAMMTEGPFIEGYIAEANPDVRPHLRVAPLPHDGPSHGGASNVLGIPSGIAPERQEAAWRFLELLSSPEWQLKFAEIAGQPPVRQGVLTESVMAAQPNMELYVRAAEEARERFPTAVPPDRHSELQQLIIDLILDVAVQDRPIPEALDAFESAVQELL